MNPIALFLQVWQARLVKARAWLRLKHRRINRSRVTRMRARVVSILLLAVVLVLGPIVAAFADAGDGASNPWMSAFGTKDSNGMTVSAYALSIDEGGATDPGKAATAFVLKQMWDVYRMWVSIALWLFDWALQFKFVDTLAGPLEMVAEALQRTTGQVHPVPMLLTLAGAFCAVWIMSGQAAKGLGGLLTALTAATLLTTALANPVAVISSEDGAIHMAKEAGISLSSQVLTNGESSSSDPEELREHSTGALVDTFVRIPHQMINYGSVIDNDKKCVKVYDKALKENKEADSDDPREAMKDCKKSYGETAESPGTGLTGMIFLAPSGGMLCLLILIFAIALIVVTAIVLFEAAMVTWNLLKATGLPGSGTTALAVAVCVMFVGLGMLIALLFGAGVYLLLLKNVLAQEENFAVAIVLLDLFLIIAVIVLLITIARARSKGRNLGEKVSKGMNSPKPGNVGTGIGTAKSMASHAAAPVASMAAHRGAMSRGNQGTGDASGGSNGAAPQPRRSGSTVGAIAKGTGKATVGAAKLGLASTVGAPVYAPRAVGASKKALAARRERLQGKFAESKAAVGAKVQKKTSDAKSFGKEYAHNVGAAGRFAGRVTGATKLGGMAAAGMGIDPVSGATAAAAASTYFSGPKKAAQTRPSTPPAAYPANGKEAHHDRPRPADERKRPPRPSAGDGDGPRPRPMPTTGGNPQAGQGNGKPSKSGGEAPETGRDKAPAGQGSGSAPRPRPAAAGGGNPQAGSQVPTGSTTPGEQPASKTPTDLPTMGKKDIEQARLEADRKAFVERMRQRRLESQRERRQNPQLMSTSNLDR